MPNARAASPGNRRYRCRDGVIAVACQNETQWQALAKCVGRPEIAYGGAWAAARLAPPRGRLGRVLEEIFAEDRPDVWLKRLSAHSVPARLN